jgi:hypothetical protein
VDGGGVVAIVHESLSVLSGVVLLRLEVEVEQFEDHLDVGDGFVDCPGLFVDF